MELGWLLKDILTNAGHDVEVATGGTEGIKLFEEKEFDRILSKNSCTITIHPLDLLPTFICSQRGPLIPNRRSFFCSSTLILIFNSGNIQVGCFEENISIDDII